MRRYRSSPGFRLARPPHSIRPDQLRPGPHPYPRPRATRRPRLRVLPEHQRLRVAPVRTASCYRGRPSRARGPQADVIPTKICICQCLFGPRARVETEALIAPFLPRHAESTPSSASIAKKSFHVVGQDQRGAIVLWKKCSRQRHDRALGPGQRGIGLVSYSRGWFDKRLYCSRACRYNYEDEGPRPFPQGSPDASLFAWLFALPTAHRHPNPVRAVVRVRTRETELRLRRPLLTAPPVHDHHAGLPSRR
jgi:hypothetical protein